MRHRRLLLVAVVAFATTTAFAGDLYWELPVLKAASGVSYSSSASNDLLLALSWQERTGSGASSAVSIWVDTARLDAPDTDTRWTGRRLVHGPIPLAGAGDEPRMHALALDGDRMLVVIVLPSTTGTEGSEVLVKSSEDAGATFRQVARFRAATIVTSPDLSRTADGGWLLLVTQPEAIVIEGTQTAQGKLSIAFSASSDGERWSELKPMVTEANLTQNIQPHHAVLGGADYVVFQSKRVTNHLYLKRSTDGGRTWDGPSIPLTSGDGFTEAVSGKVRTADEFNNQRPCLLPKGDRLGLAWERTLAGSVQAQIYYLEIDGEGRVLQPKEQVTRGGGALYPQLFELAADTRLLYAERQLGKAVQLKLAVRTVNGAIGQWSDVPVATTLPTSSLLSHGALLKDRLFVFAEALSGAGAWSLYVVRPDTSVAAPTLKPLDFSPATPANRTRVGVKWDEPADASRVSGYRYAWASDGAEVAAADLQGPSQQITLDAPEDGIVDALGVVDRSCGEHVAPAGTGQLRPGRHAARTGDPVPGSAPVT